MLPKPEDRVIHGLPTGAAETSLYALGRSEGETSVWKPRAGCISKPAQTSGQMPAVRKGRRREETERGEDGRVVQTALTHKKELPLSQLGTRWMLNGPQVVLPAAFRWTMLFPWLSYLQGDVSGTEKGQGESRLGFLNLGFIPVWGE